MVVLPTQVPSRRHSQCAIQTQNARRAKPVFPFVSTPDEMFFVLARFTLLENSWLLRDNHC
jgi:hypothetical protein